MSNKVSVCDALDNDRSPATGGIYRGKQSGRYHLCCTKAENLFYFVSLCGGHIYGGPYTHVPRGLAKVKPGTCIKIVTE